MRMLCLCVCACGLYGGLAEAADAQLAPATAVWPGWRGPRRDGASAETSWKAGASGFALKKLWSAKIGNGYASLAAGGGRVFTTGKSADGKLTDVVYCLDLESGKELWKLPVISPADEKQRKKTTLWGSCCTPWLDGGIVYAVSNWCTVSALEAETGKVVWERDLTSDMKLAPDGYSYAYASSPLVEGDVLCIAAGASGLGLDKRTGKTLWESGTSAQAHLSPVALDIDGQRGVFFVLSDFVVVRPTDGKVLCKTDRRSLHWMLSGPAYRDVIVRENFIEFAGFLLKMEEGKFGIAQMGDKRNLGHAHACYSNQLYAKGCLFSSHSYDTSNKGVNIKLEDEGYRCRDFKTGEVKWEKRGDLAGTQILVDGKIVMLVKNGQLVVFDADPAAYKELARLPIFEGYKDGVDGYQCVTCPAFVSGRILLRKGDEIVCVDARP